MKSLKILLLFFTFSHTTAFAKGIEISGGGGGNSSAAEFFKIATDSLRILKNRNYERAYLSHFNLALIDNKIFDLKVIVYDEPLTLNGNRVTAINTQSTNTIHLYKYDWINLNYRAKVQLVIHELLGLTHGGLINDSSYTYSKLLAESVLTQNIENIALTIAESNYYQSTRPIVDTTRTYIIQTYYDEGEEITVSRVYVKTFENGSDLSVRVYEFEEDHTGSIIKITYVDSEGLVGP